MDLKCKSEGCNNVYRLDVNGCGRGFVTMVVVYWECNVCHYLNMCGIESESDGKEVSVENE